VVVGRIGGPYGVRGWVHVSAFTDPKENIGRYGPWLLKAGGEQDWRPASPCELKAHRQDFVARFCGIEDRAAAEALKGSLIGVPEAELPEPEEDEFYWRDLTGMDVVEPDGRCLGRVTGLMETGVNDVLVIATRTGELLVPFHRQFVLNVDADRRRIVVEWPDEA
jgi:16S rRNA processing protein RimM